MTYEEAIKEQREWLKDSIRIRLYKIDPIKYKRFKGIYDRNRVFKADDIAHVWDVVSIIHTHEVGNIFERDDLFYRTIKNKSK